MPEDFDYIAPQYDETFTNTNIGKFQRELVYQFLEAEVNEFEGKIILELNGGTGEDAVWMSKKGAEVTCTDISNEMLAVAKSKGKGFSISYKKLDIKELSKEINNQKYDVVFSNFGGLNCLNTKELKSFFNEVKHILQPNGKLIMVIMPSFCLWETNYFLAKLKFKKAFRRLSKNGVYAQVENTKVKTYYYSPKFVKTHTKNFSLSSLKPVGFFIPPSYLEPFFKTRPKFLNWLWKMENKIKKRSFFSSCSDHYFISLTLNK